MAPRHPNTASLEVSGRVALTLGLGALLLGATAPAVALLILSAGLLSIRRAREHGWSSERLGVTAASLFGAALFTLVGWAVARVLGVLVVGLVAWSVWRLTVRGRVRKL